MRALLLTATLVAGSVPSVALAQEPAEDKHPKHGGLGFVQVGMLAGPMGDLGDALSAETALGAGAKSPEFGYTVGGGGRLLLFHRLVIGGKGFGLFPPEVGGANGKARIGGGGGGLELGFAAVNRPKVLLFPYFGVGGFGLGLELENTSLDRIQFGDAAPLEPGEIRDYAAGFVYLEVGAGLHRLLFLGDGGFAVGFNFGGLFSVAPSDWTDSGTPIEGLDQPRLSGAYLQLTVGGGGFFFE